MTFAASCVIGRVMISIPIEKIKSDSGFYVPAAKLIAAVKEYYKRELGLDVSNKKIETEILRIIKEHL